MILDLTDILVGNINIVVLWRGEGGGEGLRFQTFWDNLGIIFYSTNESTHWVKDNISKPNLNNSILLKNANLDNSILQKCQFIVTFIVEMTNGIFRSQSRVIL